MEPLSLIDRELVAAQIGRPPRGAVVVAVRCVYGYPQVIRVRPLVDGEPFPTLYWLTCPYLSRALARLEAEGWIHCLERRMAADPVLAASMDAAHTRYADARAALLHEPDLAMPCPGRGIGGIADRQRLKCLHLHVAHALADVNPIGEIALGQLERSHCPPQRILCRAAAGTGRFDPPGDEAKEAR